MQKEIVIMIYTNHTIVITLHLKIVYGLKKKMV